MNFAVIKTGGKQYKVSAGDSISIERLKGEYKVGDTLTFDEVLLKTIGDTTDIGTPTIKGTGVKGTITEIGRAEKVLVVRYRAKSRYHKKNGHRQPLMKVTIDSL